MQVVVNALCEGQKRGTVNVSECYSSCIHVWQHNSHLTKKGCMAHHPADCMAQLQQQGERENEDALSQPRHVSDYYSMEQLWIFGGKEGIHVHIHCFCPYFLSLDSGQSKPHSTALLFPTTSATLCGLRTESEDKEKDPNKLGS